jgi:hypothetical protein
MESSSENPDTDFEMDCAMAPKKDLPGESKVNPRPEPAMGMDEE